MKKWTPRQIRSLRAGRRWRQVDLAGMLGISIDNVQNYEQGRYRPRARLLRLLDLIDTAKETT